MEYLQGGRKNKIGKVDNVVYRPAGFWSTSVFALLNHVRAQGVLSVPKPLGFDTDGREMVSFLAGEVCNYPLSTNAVSRSALVSAAKLLRTYHDATVSLLNENHNTFSWLLPPRYPAEVICHGDFAPYNIVLNENQAIGIIDFDTAHPAPRAWDIAYALYRWAPFTHPDNKDGFGTLIEQIERGRLFCTSYGLDAIQCEALPALIIERLSTLVDYMIQEAAAGNEAFQANLNDGHHSLYRADIRYIEQHLATIEAGLNLTS